MARENSIFVRIKADGSSFFSTMKQANASLRTVDKSFKEYGATVDEQRAKTNALRDSYRELSTGFLTAGAAIIGGLGLMAAKYSQFDKAMSVFDAHADANAEQMEQLGQVAMDTGHKYGISALEAVEAATNLAKAGIAVEDVLGGGLEGALTLAATGNLSVADSAETAAIAMTQFGLSGEDVPHIADLLAAAAGKAVGEVADMSWALRQAGLVANGMGLSIEETTGTLSAFAMAGLIGSDAGTSFKSMLLAIQSPSGVAKKKMDELGLSFYDANGDFIGITASAQMLQDRLWHLSQEQRNAALSTIFGQDAIRSASILYEEGAEGVQGWINKVNDSGYAAELAEAKLDNLQGDLSKLGVSFENLIFGSGSGFNEFLRDAVQAADSFLQVLGKIPAPVFNTGIALAGIAGAGALGIGAFMKLAVAAADTKDALHTLGMTSDVAKGKMGGLSKAGAGLAKLGAYGVGIAFLAAGIASLANTTAPAEIGLSKIGNALSDTKKGIEPLNAAFRDAEWANGNISGAMGTVKDINSIGDAVVRLGERSESGLARFEDAGNRMLGVNSSWVKAADDIAAVDESLANMVKNGNADHAAEQFQEIVSSIRDAGGDVATAQAQFTEYEAAIRDYATTLGVSLTEQQVFEAMMGNLPPVLTDAAGGADAAAEGIAGMGEAAGDATMELEDLLDAMFQLGLIKMTSRDAATEYAEALRGTADAAKEIAESETGLGRILNDTASDFDLATEAGKLANDSFQGIADAGMEVVKSNAYLDSSFDAVRGNLQTTYDDLKATAEGWGINEEAAAKLAAEVLGVPDGVNIDTWMDDQANRVAENTGAAVNDIPEQKRVTIDTNAEDVEVGLEQVRIGLGQIPPEKEIRTLVTDNGTIDVVQVGVDNLTGKKVVAEVSDDGTVSDVQYRVDTIEGKTVLVPVSDGGTIPATQGDVNAMYGKTLQTIVTDEGTVSLTQQEVNEMQGRIIETKVTDDGTLMVVQGGIDNIHGSQETILVDDNGTASVVQQDINNVQGRTVYVDIIQRYSSIGDAVSQSKGMLKPGMATGGRFHDLPGHADGVRLPSTGPGTHMTDGFLGIDSMSGRPRVRLDGGEWIINNRRSQEYHGILAAINNGTYLKGLPGHATGTRLDYAAAGSSYTPRGGDLGYTQNGGAGITAVVDPAPIAQAVHAAMSEYRPVIKLDNRTIYGSNVRARKQMERR